MTAGVQNLEPAAYLPPPPSASTPDAKATGAADAQSPSQDFQAELQLQNSTAPETKPAGPPVTSSAKSGSAKSSSDKSGSAKFGKKRDPRSQDSNSAMVTPVQPSESQKQVLPLVLTLAKPEERDQPDEHAGKPAELSPQQTPAGSVAVSVTPDSSSNPVLPVAADLPAPAEVTPVAEATNTGDRSAVHAQPSTSSQSPLSWRAGIRLQDAIPPEPVAAALQATADSASSSPSALAFAARISAAPQKAGQAVSADPAQPADAPSSPTPARMPVRYAATAQILQNSDAEPKPAAGAAVDRSARLDMVLPRIESASEAPSSAPAAPQQPAPTAQMERIFNPPAAEPRAALPTSAHDIRVQVPDTKGGSTQVRFVESGGEVRVSVRTADDALAQNLRGHLNELAQRLVDGGVPAEIWKPGSSASSSQNNQQQPARDGRGSGGQQSGGQGGQQARQGNRPAWLDEMEASLNGPQE